MYRADEVRLFNVLSIAGDASIALALLALGPHYFFPQISFPFKALSLLGVIFSGFFKIQIFMYKVLIMEKRLLHLVEPSLQHFKIASRWSAVHLVIYFVFFWIVLIGVILSFIPIR